MLYLHAWCFGRLHPARAVYAVKVHMSNNAANEVGVCAGV